MKEKEAFVRQFREIQPKFSRFYAHLLTEAGLTLPQFALLSQLLGKRVSMTEVSGKLHISKPAVTSLVDRLEEKHLLKRVAHPDDRRVSLLRIQPKGETIVRRAQAEAFRFLLKAIDRLSVSEQKVIVRFYALLSQVMDQALTKMRE